MELVRDEACQNAWAMQCIRHEKILLSGAARLGGALQLTDVTEHEHRTWGKAFPLAQGPNTNILLQGRVNVEHARAGGLIV